MGMSHIVEKEIRKKATTPCGEKQNADERASPRCLSTAINIYYAAALVTILTNQRKHLPTEYLSTISLSKSGKREK